MKSDAELFRDVSMVSDPELARSAADAIEQQLPHCAPLIRIVVHDGHVKLEGTLDWQYQRERAEECIRRLRGVRMISNLISLKNHCVGP